ncbi:coenzyme F430 synthase [Methanolobus profundi]|uniref:UDP-N-acetylmuramyl pentapeptide synthase n=1 Tax=Methanolobus profundi TaxID=487685 RepID=A0A1I4SCK3_9EURY|nr:coenzyme F430 synthase [Methanolobus profundi]SFM62208.1 UDP-N-acetylmuramyl pentapeptide synthase [Methanolobus profundi]
MFNYSNIAVLDLTHAGIIIAEKLADLGLNVTAIDVYGTVDENTLSVLGSAHGIKTSKEAVPVDGFDLIVSPAHLDPEYPMLSGGREKNIEIMTHHRAVGHILSMTGSLEGAKVIEITGSKAKTSSASLLAAILSMRMQVVLHTSRGLELWEKGISRVLHLGLSIAPGSILLAVDKLKELGVSADCYILEVSIGLTGYADVGIITTLEPDYLIAASTSSASDSKISVLGYGRPDELFFLNIRDHKALDMAEDNGRQYRTFSDSKDINADLKAYFGDDGIIVENSEGTFTSSLSSNYNSTSYATAFAVSTSVALWMGIPVDDISSVICSFEGLQGRMQKKMFSGRELIDNSNSGMDIRSVEKALDYALSKTGKSVRIIMVLGEEAAQVCEGLPPEDVSEFINRRGNDLETIILVGERMQGIVSDNIMHSPGLEEGLDMAAGLSSQEDLLLSCVKCFR